MAVYAPDDSYSGGSSSAAADPNLLQRLWTYINPTTAAQAGGAPDPNSDAARKAALAAAAAQLGPNAAAPAGPSAVDAASSVSTAPLAPPQPQPNPYTGIQPGLGAPNYTNPFLAAGAGPSAGLNAGTPLPAASAVAGQPARPVTPTPATVASRPARPVTPTPATAYPPDNTFTYVVPNSQQGRTPIYTAGQFNLFGGGGANPANVPAAAAQPVSAVRGGALAKGGADALTQAISKPDWWKNLKGVTPPPDVIASRSLKQRYG